ncbi:zinc finger MYM-type protein 1-like [Eleginops maclovinus]
MQMKNGERISRTWLVYSKAKDAAKCFCCQLFGKGDTQLSSTNGFNHWNNLQVHLKQHERSAAHVKNMGAWHTLNARLQSGSAIDQEAQNLMTAEVIRCREVMKRLLAIVCHLAQYNLAFRGHREKLFEHGNGNFLGQVQLMAKFDPVMKEHLWKMKAKQIADTYLSKRIQNELICLVAQCTTDALVERVRRAKYYAVIMDCTPDVSHNEQLSVLLRIVNCELTKGVSIHEHFMGFLVADDTTGQGLLQLFLGHLERLGLDLSNCRGQSYDNGSNMQGKTQGVQARMLELNPKALCVPCGSHTLNLVVGDAAKSSTISLGYFGTLQRLYTLFSGSVQRWTILQEHVKAFSVKALSTTRWECRVDAVKAVRYQLPEIVDALTAVHKHATLKKDPECASTADSLKENMMKWSFMISTDVHIPDPDA